MRGKESRAAGLPREMTAVGFSSLPAMVKRSGDAAISRFIEFFILGYRNKNTREGYARDLRDFCRWCEDAGIERIQEVKPGHVAAHIEWLLIRQARAESTVKRHLAAIRKLFDWLVVGHIIEVSPAGSVKGPAHVVTRGLTPEMSPEEVKRLLTAIPKGTLIGLRDRALLGVLLYSWARASAVCNMEVRDYALEKGKRVFRLREKGGKPHRITAHRKAQALLEQYLSAARLRSTPGAPLFQTCDPQGRLTGKPLPRNDVFRIVRKCAKAAGLPPGICAHSCRATGITEYVRNGGDLRIAQKIANHASIRTTQLYMHLDDDAELAEIERVDY